MAMNNHTFSSNSSSSSSSSSSWSQTLSLEGWRLQRGHIIVGIGFTLVGLWHLYNQVKMHITHNKTYKSLPWYPTKFLSRYLEPGLILVASTIYASMELSFAPFDPDGSFSTTQIHHIEHSCIALSYFLHALFAILLDKLASSKTGFKPQTSIDMGSLLAAVAFAEELLILHFHSTDHFGLEEQYHILLQILVLMNIVFSLLSIGYPKSFMVCFIRSITIIFHGLWLFIIGIMLWTPKYAPKGCSLIEDIVNCNDPKFLGRAKALVTILFSWVFLGIMGFGVVFYLVINKVHEVNEMDVDDGYEKGHIEDMQGLISTKEKGCVIL